MIIFEIYELLECYSATECHVVETSRIFDEVIKLEIPHSS